MSPWLRVCAGRYRRGAIIIERQASRYWTVWVGLLAVGGFDTLRAARAWADKRARLA